MYNTYITHFLSTNIKSSSKLAFKAGSIVAKMASHAIFQYNILAIDDTHNTWTNMIVKDDHSQAFRFK